MRLCGIYQITNLVNNKKYIGSSVDIKRRWAIHKTQLKNDKHPNPKLQHGWNKHGESNFLFVIISLCEREELLIKEQAAMDLFNPEYNIQAFAGVHLTQEKNGQFGKTHSKETLEKMSIAKKGKPKSEETKAKMKAAWAKRKEEEVLGIREKVKHSPEARLAQSERCKGKKPAGLTNQGNKHSEETKAKMSESQKGKPVSEDTKKKISDKLSGIPLSEERKKQMREGWKKSNYKQTPEHIENKASKLRGFKQSPEEIAKRVASRIANNIPAHNKGKAMSEEQKEKLKGIKRTPEQIANNVKARAASLESRKAAKAKQQTN